MSETDAKSRYVTLVWLGWLILAAAVLFAPTRLVFEKLARVLPRHYDLFLLALLVLAVAVVVYVYLLRRAFWKFELASLAAAAATACLVYEPWATVVSLWLVAAGYLAGNRLLDAFGIGVTDPLDEVGLGLTLGLGTLSFVLFFLGTLNLFSPWVFAALLTLPFLIGYRRLPALARLSLRLHRKWAATEELRSPIVGIGVGFAVVFVIFALTTALTPSISYDSVKFHLVLTELFAAQGGTAPMASVYYSFFPQGVEVLLTAGHALAGQAAAQIIAPVFFPLSLITLVLLGRQCGWKRAGVVAGVLAGLSMPVVHWNGSNVKKTTQAIEALAAHRRPGERVMSLETCGAAYYPQPWLVECFVVSTDFQSWDETRGKLEEEKYDYLVAPLSRLTEQLPHSHEISRGKGITARRIDWPPPDR